MKLINHLKRNYSLISVISLLSGFFIAFIFISCSTEEVDVNSDLINQDLKTADLKQGIHYETWQDQINRLKKKTNKFNNIQVALSQGWDTQVTDHMPGMGVHYLNLDLADDKFEMELPEALLYISTDSGMQFVGVEYLIFGLSPDGPAPEGFIGDNDVWVYNTDVLAWTLHAWVALENSNGIFAPTNPDVY